VLAFLAVLGSEPAAHAAGPDPAAEAQSLLAKLDAPGTRELVQDPVAKAKAAQQRAQSARGAGDLRHATELDALALTWAHVADDLVRTAESEKKLAELQKTVTDLEQKAVRTQALIEQTIARRGRAEQNLKNAGPSAGPASKSELEKPAKELSPAKAKPSTPAVKPSTPAVKPSTPAVKK
jgi:chromosome segregation ATPase